jgi:hypothetical protein
MLSTDLDRFFRPSYPDDGKPKFFAAGGVAELTYAPAKAARKPKFGRGGRRHRKQRRARGRPS